VDASGSHWLKAGKRDQALDPRRGRGVVRRVKEHRWLRCSTRARTKQRRRQRSKRLGVTGSLRKPAADDLSGGLPVWKRSRDVSVRTDRDRVRGIDDQLAGQEVRDLVDYGFHRAKPQGQDDRVCTLYRVAVAWRRRCPTSDLGGQLCEVVRVYRRDDHWLAAGRRSPA